MTWWYKGEAHRTNVSVDEWQDRGNVSKACNTSHETQTDPRHGADEERAGEVALGQSLLLDLKRIVIVRGIVMRGLHLLYLLVVVLLAERDLVVESGHGASGV